MTHLPLLMTISEVAGELRIKPAQVRYIKALTPIYVTKREKRYRRADVMDFIGAKCPSTAEKSRRPTITAFRSGGVAFAEARKLLIEGKRSRLKKSSEKRRKRLLLPAI